MCKPFLWKNVYIDMHNNIPFGGFMQHPFPKSIHSVKNKTNLLFHTRSKGPTENNTDNFHIARFKCVLHPSSEFLLTDISSSDPSCKLNSNSLKYFLNLK